MFSPFFTAETQRFAEVTQRFLRQKEGERELMRDKEVFTRSPLRSFSPPLFSLCAPLRDLCASAVKSFAYSFCSISAP
jgi:hypothetical protein